MSLQSVPGGAPGPNARTTRKRPADYTGKLKEEQETAVAEQLEETANQISRANAARVKENSEIIDYTGADVPLPEVDITPLEVASPFVTMRVNYPIEDMTFGREILDEGDAETGRPPIVGPLRNFSFEEGRSYRVPRDLYDHLDRKGYVWH